MRREYIEKSCYFIKIHGGGELCYLWSSFWSCACHSFKNSCRYAVHFSLSYSALCNLGLARTFFYYRYLLLLSRCTIYSSPSPKNIFSQTLCYSGLPIVDTFFFHTNVLHLQSHFRWHVFTSYCCSCHCIHSIGGSNDDCIL